MTNVAHTSRAQSETSKNESRSQRAQNTMLHEYGEEINPFNSTGRSINAR